MSWLRSACLYFLVVPAFFSTSAQNDGNLPDLIYESINPRVTLVTAHFYFDSVAVPANYLIIEGDSFSLLLDTPWDNAQTDELLNWCDVHLKRPLKKVIITHSHIDRMGGIAAVHRRGLETYIHPKAQEMNDVAGEYEPAMHLIEDELVIDAGGITARVLYPGDGHAPGNLIVQVGREGVYGGCFLKSASGRNIGNLEDADLNAWKTSLDKIEHLFVGLIWEVPGHGPADIGAFKRTRELVNHELDQME